MEYYWPSITGQKRTHFIPTLKSLSDKVESVRSDLLRGVGTLQIPTQEVYDIAKNFLRRCLMARRCTRQVVHLS